MSALRRKLAFALAFTIAVSGQSLRAASGDSKPSLDPAMAAAHAAAKGDSLLEALLTELDRSKSQLKMDQVQPPYFIEYRVNDVEDYSAEAAFGALRESQHAHYRVLRVVVRIGDYKQDSYFGEGMGTVEVMPIDNNEMALRHQLWLATDKAYKAALGGLTEKQAALKNVVVEHDIPDFSQEKPADSVRDLAKLDVDLDKWKQVLRSTSDLFRADPDLQSSEAILHFRVLNRYFVNTEGTVARNGKTIYTLVFSGSDQADDGMHLERSHGWVVAKADELPKADSKLSDPLKNAVTFGPPAGKDLPPAAKQEAAKAQGPDPEKAAAGQAVRGDG